jgi:hypothetical protein
MSVTPETVQAALQTIKTAYYDECHLAADAVFERVQSGEITTDEALWDAIVETHQARVSGEPVTPKWTPILLSEYWFDDAPAVPPGAARESDVLWEYNRIAWVNDVCHVLREHHHMTVEGTSRERFLAGHPLDSISTPQEVTERVALELEGIAIGVEDLELRRKIRNQSRRLKAIRPLNPSPSATRRRCKE